MEITIKNLKKQEKPYYKITLELDFYGEERMYDDFIFENKEDLTKAILDMELICGLYPLDVEDWVWEWITILDLKYCEENYVHEDVDDFYTFNKYKSFII